MAPTSVSSSGQPSSTSLIAAISPRYSSRFMKTSLQFEDAAHIDADIKRIAGRHGERSVLIERGEAEQIIRRRSTRLAKDHRVLHVNDIAAARVPCQRITSEAHL